MLSRSRNFPSEVLVKQSDANLDVCDHFLQLIPMTIGAGSPMGDTVRLIHHRLQTEANLRGIKPRFVKQIQPLHLLVEIWRAYVHLNRNKEFLFS